MVVVVVVDADKIWYCRRAVELIIAAEDSAQQKAINEVFPNKTNDVSIVTRKNNRVFTAVVMKVV